jgi:hypothetical protein
MSIEGPKTWAGVIEDQAPRLLKLVVAAWKRVAPGAPDEKEDDITKRLCVALQRTRTVRKMMFYVHPQIVELDPSTGDEFGRMDIGFYPSNQPWVPREDIYFCLECKRLNVVKGNNPPRAYATEYVTLGVARFVTGQYSRAVSHAAMIGYVRDGQVDRAIENVEAAIAIRSLDLGMESPGRFVVSAVFPRRRNMRETSHRREGRRAIRVHHMFMAGSPVSGKAAIPT